MTEQRENPWMTFRVEPSPKPEVVPTDPNELEAVTLGFIGGGAFELPRYQARKYIGHPRYPNLLLVFAEEIAEAKAEAKAEARRKARADARAKTGLIDAKPEPAPIPPLPEPLAKPGSPRLLLDRQSLQAPPESEAAVYRASDSDGLLLYVGFTADLRTRQWSHLRNSTWYEFAETLAVQWFSDSTTALAAERAAIRDETPLWNKQNNNTQAAQTRLVEYLIGKDRLDLLAPIMSNVRSSGKPPAVWLV